MNDPGRTFDTDRGLLDYLEPKVLKQAHVVVPEGARAGDHIAIPPDVAIPVPNVTRLVEMAVDATAALYETKDTGTREDFATGSRRDNREGKGRYDLLPPYALQRVAQVFERGADKYDAHNWRLGQPLTRYLDSALRHTFQVLEGKTDEDHAGHAIFNLLAFIDTQERVRVGDLPAELDDLWRSE